MDKDRLLRQLMTTFIGELDEHVRSLNRDLLALEKHPHTEGWAELLKSLFRTAHSLKGAARSVNVQVIEAACHRLEEILAAVRDDRLEFDRELFSLVFAATDAIAEAGNRLRGSQDLTDAPLAALLSMLDAAASRAARQTTVPLRGSAANVSTVAAGAASADERGQVLCAAERPSQPAATVATPLTFANDSGAPSARGPRSREPSAPSARSDISNVSLCEPLPLVGRTAAASNAPSNMVRVPAEKLDALLADSGELLVARRRLQSRAQDLVSLRECVGQWKADWKGVERSLRKLLDHETGHDFDNGASPSSDGPAPAGPHFPAFTHRQALVLAQTSDRLGRLEKELERLCANIADDGRLLDQAASRLDEEVDRVRMLPFAEACQGLERTVRDLAHAGGREVDFFIEGGDVELDRSILEGLKDPLLHLVRNAIDHGIEPPGERRSVGKSPRGRIAVAAALRGGLVEVVVADDGRGLDIEGLREQARKRGLPEPADEQGLTSLVFLPGFSTARIITDVSGRGVGLDVVKSRVESLLGTVDLSSQPGRGTRFTITAPLTLTTLRVVLVTAGGETFAVPDTNVQKLIRLSPEDLRSVEGRQMVSLGAVPVLVASLAETLGLRASDPARPGSKLPALVVAAGEQRVALVVDELVAKQEVVVKSLGSRIRRVKHFSGATLLPSGRIALVLNAATLVRTAVNRPPSKPIPTSIGPDSVAKKRLLLAEDSVTTRSLVKSILEVAGYEVLVAADGEAAWQVLQEQDVEVVVSDVEMPRMDGFALTEAIRNSKRFHDLPVILVTARETDQDKARGIELGANAYLLKSAFDQRNLVETIAQLL